MKAAQGHGTTAGRLEELFDRCDVVALAVPPAVQADLAPLAARAGKALLLEKPLADSLPAAERWPTRWRRRAFRRCSC